MNTCKTCKRDDLTQINAQLVKGVSIRNIMSNFDGLSTGAIHRHRDNCIPDLIAAVVTTRRNGLLAELDDLRIDIDAMQSDFFDNPTARNAALQRRFDAITQEAKITGAYVQAAVNPADATTQAAAFVAEMVAKGVMDREDAVAFALEQYPGAVIASESVH